MLNGHIKAEKACLHPTKINKFNGKDIIVMSKCDISNESSVYRNAENSYYILLPCLMCLGPLGRGPFSTNGEKSDIETILTPVNAIPLMAVILPGPKPDRMQRTVS
uniref:Uncharacterized protein n=1 Tax=Romanomermis culicivorax TaxID=13658 RepID=A0A915HN02_ROMCU